MTGPNDLPLRLVRLTPAEERKEAKRREAKAAIARARAALGVAETADPEEREA